MRIKDYLSFSQYSTYNASEKSYIKMYIQGIKLSNKYLDFGKHIGTALDDRDFKGDHNQELARELVGPRPDICEEELRETFNGIPLLGYADGTWKEQIKIDEYKTGKTAWTQKKVDKHEQLTFYAIMKHLQTGLPIEAIDIELIWLPTIEDTDGSMLLTGEVKRFKTVRTNMDMIRIYPKIKKAWIGIERLVDEYLKT